MLLHENMNLILIHIPCIDFMRMPECFYIYGVDVLNVYEN